MYIYSSFNIEKRESKNTRECANKTKKNLETNQESNQQKLGTPAQTPNKTIQIPLEAASSSTSTPQTPRTPSYTDKIKQWFENCEEKSESESKKKTSEKTITKPVTETSSQFRNQETHDQKEELNIREATFRNTQRNIIPPPLRPISPPAENGNKMATPYIVRLTDFSREEEETDMHTWLREAQKAIQTNNWNDQRAIQTLPFFLKGTADFFTEFKNALLKYFSDPNAIIQLQNKFNTIKQNTSKTVTQYLAQFNRICHQIEAIKQGYYTDPQILNQFIRGLKSSILGRVCPAHPNFLPEAIMLTRALESAEKEANHSQMVNMVMEENKTETLKKRVMQLGEELSKKIEKEIPTNHSKDAARKSAIVEIIGHCAKNLEQKCAPAIFANINQYMLISHQYFTTYQNQGAYQQQSMIANPNWHLEAQNQPMWNQNQTNSNYQNYQQTYLNILKNLIIGNNDSRNINRTKNSSNKLSQTIPPAVATKNSSLAAIFLFELEENEAMFSGAALDKKCLITAIYTETTVNNTPIKLILDSGSTRSIIMFQLVNQLGFKVDHATTSQIITADGSIKLSHALVRNDWLIKANVTLDWTTQKLLINYNGHQARIPATCGHFQKPSTNQRLIFKFKENSALPAIETY
ncbi:hypothetical protein G9A89_021346 [Geosiphon pyriformis]|nr:hypothetical protein G9A89_021346 [Geosiphon pyriformis]